METELTPSERARYVRAELEVVIAALRGDELLELLARAREMLECTAVLESRRRTYLPP